MCFVIDFGWVWGGFGEDFERGLEPLGASWASFWRLFLRLVFVGRCGIGSWLHFGRYGAGFGSILGGTELDFGSILEGTELDFGCLLKGCLGVVWGGLWEGFGRVWRVENCSFLGI